jgi:hypothetical protein
MRNIPLLFGLSCIVLLFICGCATPQYNYRPESKEISAPPLDTVSVANVGDEMLKQGTFVEREAIYIDRSLKIGLFSYYTLLPGYYIKTGENEDSEFYQPAEGGDGGRIVKAALVDPWESIQLYKRENKIGIVTIFHAHVLSDATGVKRTTHLLLSDNSFQQTLIYSGKVGNKIKIGYREFSNDQARPAFNNDVDYDLDESTTIGYKGARIEVIEATNQLIRYRVLSNFNRAEF